MNVTGWIIFVVFALVLVLLGAKIFFHDYYSSIAEPIEHATKCDFDHPVFFRDVVLWLGCVIVEAVAAGLIWG
ncbi:TPA: hypothetical protein DF272_02640 [Candidatus Falkowbacteria bacterium]|nr:hypothetical protein [Candidatus Falkowbacteria bacterium]